MPRRLPASVRAATLAALALLTAACGRAAPDPAPGPAPVVEAPAPAVTFAWAAATRRLVLESRAAITVAGDTAEARDTVVTTLHATLFLPDGAGPRRLQGTIDSVAVRAGAHIPATPAAVPTPIAFEAVVVEGAIRPLPPATPTPDCTSPAGTLLASVRELMPSVPSRLAPGTRWADTVATTTCRGGVVLTTTTAHEYVVTGPGAPVGDTPTMRLDRTSTITVHGEGEQARERVTVAGEGTGRATLLLDRPVHAGASASRLLAIDGESRLTLTFTGAGRVERVVQEGTTSVRETSAQLW